MKRERQALSRSYPKRKAKTCHQMASGQRPPQLLAAKACTAISDPIFLSKHGNKASFDWLLLLWCSKKTCLTEGGPVQATEAKLPRVPHGSGETQESDQGDRFRLLVPTRYRGPPRPAEWKFTEERSSLRLHQFNLLHLLLLFTGSVSTL